MNSVALDVEKLLNLSRELELLIKSDVHSSHYQDEGQINMRDQSRFLNLYRTFLEEDSVDSDSSLLHAFKICYL
jgi:hypothetical protein